MSSIPRVRVLSEDEYAELGVIGTPTDESGGRAFSTALRRSILLTREWLLAAQHEDGYWVGELEGDTILESEYILLLAYLGRHGEPIAKRAARFILEKQLPDGGWSIYPGGKMEISASVKAYFALKLTGHDPADEPLQRAREAILRHGGADTVNSFTRFYLALLGQISYEQCPAVPPEFLLVPKWFPVNLYSISAWSRTILVPLSIMSVYQPVAKIPSELGIRELFLRSPDHWPPLRCPGLKRSTGLFSWDRFFRVSDRLFKFCQRHRLSPLRGRAVQAAKSWMIERFQDSDGLGAIFPPMIWSIVALRCLGYGDESKELKYCHERLAGLVIDGEGSARLQPCKSPVWDTAITLRALAEAGVAKNDPRIRRAVHWLLDHEVRAAGDWSNKVKAEPGGWYFEHANAFYPDNDDTAMVLMALLHQFDEVFTDTSSTIPELGLVSNQICATLELARQDVEELDRVTGAVERASRWLAAMQNRDGGWGAFDKDNVAEFLCHVPFADHNAMIDPSSPDLAARVLECLGKLGRRIGDPAVDRCVAYLRRTQEADGSWFGRWGVNYIYGTWQVLVGLKAVGVAPDDEAIVAGANWLLAYQQTSGGWGESPDSYADPRLKGQGNPTASQTAWALLGLIAANKEYHPAVERGIRFLVERQRKDGTWDEDEFTGTGFPQVFYLKYHLYRVYFPLMALCQFAKCPGRVEMAATSSKQNSINLQVVGA